MKGTSHKRAPIFPTALTRVIYSVVHIKWKEWGIKLTEKVLHHISNSKHIIGILVQHRSLFILFKSLPKLFNIALTARDTINAFSFQTTHTLNGLNTFDDNKRHGSAM